MDVLTRFQFVMAAIGVTLATGLFGYTLWKIVLRSAGRTEPFVGDLLLAGPVSVGTVMWALKYLTTDRTPALENVSTVGMVLTLGALLLLRFVNRLPPK